MNLMIKKFTSWIASFSMLLLSTSCSMLFNLTDNGSQLPPLEITASTLTPSSVMHVEEEIDGSMMLIPTAISGLNRLPDGSLITAGISANGVAFGTESQIFDAAAAGGSGAWKIGPSLNAIRDRHASVTLSDGRILVVGGQTAGSVALNTAEIFDPSANAGAGGWLVAASMTDARTNTNLILLNDGRVLAIGGRYLNSALITSEIFDPTTNGGLGSWTAGPNLTTARMYHASAKLIDGRVLVTGGQTGAIGASLRLQSAEIFDPAGNAGLGSFTPTANMPAIKLFHSAVTLDDDRVLLSGGASTGGISVATAFLFDPASGNWTTTGSMPSYKTSHASFPLTDGRAIAVDSSSQIFIFDPSVGGGTWTTATAMLDASLPLKAVQVNGDTFDMVDSLYRVQRFNTTANSGLGEWTLLGEPPLSTSKNSHSALTLTDGRVLVLGSGTATYVFDPSLGNNSDALVAVASPTKEHRNAVSVLLQDGRALIAGGTDAGAAIKTVEIYDPEQNQWTLATDMNFARSNTRGLVLADGRVLVTGGTVGGSLSNTIEIYDPTQNTWTNGTNMPGAKMGHSMLLLKNEKVMAIGGMDASQNGLASAYLFEPDDNAGLGSWTSLASMGSLRGLTSSVQLEDARVLVSGGSANIFNPLHFDTAEIYDPVGNSWSPTGNMTQNRGSHVTYKLQDGRIIVIGGENCLTAFSNPCRGLTDIDVFDPDANSGAGSWSTLTSMSAGRRYFASTMLQDGRIFLHGGSSANTVAENEVFIISPFETVDLTIQDGRAPYTFGVLSGSASVSYDGTSNTMKLVPSDFGTILLQVTDAAGRIGEISVTVSP